MTMPEDGRFRYDQAQYEAVTCNLCGGTGSEIIARRDRNGLDVHAVICTHCGLIYLSPRMTPEWYGRYYAQEYRRQIAAFHRATPRPHRDCGDLFVRQQHHGEALVGYLRSCEAPDPRSILEIGSSAGGVLHALGVAYDATVLGVEPTPSEAEFAARHGVPTEVGLFEEFGLKADRRFDLVLCTQTFNHLLDPRGVARRIAQLLTPNGVFLLECQDFFQLCRAWGGDRSKAVQIDHTHMFTPETLTALVDQSGLQVLAGSVENDENRPAFERRRRLRASLPSLHVRLLARRSDAPAPPVPHHYPRVRSRLDSLHPKPVRTWIRRAWERQMSRLDRLREA
jgi:SAM-dependent methyltransferase